MEQKTEPCPLCGKEEDSWENKIKQKKQEQNRLEMHIEQRNKKKNISKHL